MEVRLPAGSWTAIASASMGAAIASIPLAGSHLLVQPDSAGDFFVFAAVAAVVVALVVRTSLLDAWTSSAAVVAFSILALVGVAAFFRSEVHQAPGMRASDVFHGTMVHGFAGGLAGLVMGFVVLPPVEAVAKARRRFGGVHRASVICGAWLLAMCVAGGLLDPASDEGRVGMLLSFAGFVMAVVILARGIEGVRATRRFVERVRIGEVHDLRLAADGRSILGPVGAALDYRGEEREWKTVALLP